ncbi:ornithine cyclodeaminase family protein [Candidatus Pacearchaeota archaeon]|nr:ornithine cyclodeaminase family protein [Candidatus Pacearchaeota archaeon]
MSTVVLTSDDVRKLLDMSSVIAAVEQAFIDWTIGSAVMPPKAYLPVDNGDFRAMPAALKNAAGLKWVNVHPQNVSIGLPTVMATLIYNDPKTGYPLAIMDGTLITAYRTGAASAIASKYLARRNPKTLGIIGVGRQAYTQLLAHIEIFSLVEIRVFDISQEAVDRFIEFFGHLPIRQVSMEETSSSDIICTLTTAREPILKSEWVFPGTHINAVGADAEGKEELDPALVIKGQIVVDDWRQASMAGEINVPLKKGLIKRDEVYASLGEIIIGIKKGRLDQKVITIFDSTGIAVQDIAVAKLVYDRAIEEGGFQSIDLVEGKLNHSSKGQS